MSYSYDRRPTTRTASFLITKVAVDVDVNLDPDRLSWTSKGNVLLVGEAAFVLPHAKYKSQPYELELSEDGKVLRCDCPDPMQRQLISMAARGRARELVELIDDEKVRGALRSRPKG